MRKTILSLLVALGLIAKSHASVLLYDNGSYSVGENNPSIYTLTVADSFVINSISTINSATIAILVPTDSSNISSITWSINTQPLGGTIISSGISSITNSTYLGVTAGGELKAYSNSFKVSATNLNVGTYYFQLSGADVMNTFWADGGTTSTAYATLLGNLSSSQSFQLYGTSTAVPEPSTYALFAIGALALVIAYRRKVA
jgi:hypothetical protein